MIRNPISYCFIRNEFLRCFLPKLFRFHISNWLEYSYNTFSTHLSINFAFITLILSAHSLILIAYIWLVLNIPARIPITHECYIIKTLVIELSTVAFNIHIEIYNFGIFFTFGVEIDVPSVIE